MSRPETEATEGLRDILDFRGQFDVFLACAFEECERGQTKFELYDRIGEVVRKIGKRPFLPHREIGLEWSGDVICPITKGIVIPTSDVVLCYLGLPSSAAGVFLARAVKTKAPFIYLFENPRDFEGLKVRIDEGVLGSGTWDIGFKDYREIFKPLEFDAVNVFEGVSSLENSLRRFYRLG